MKRSFTILVLVAATAAAQPPWPNRALDDSKLRSERVETAALPKALREALTSFDEFAQGTETLPETLDVCRVDLNRDGTPEFIVDSQQSYSGGTTRIIFQRDKRGYHSIAYIQGSVHLLSRYNSYYQLECWGRAGGGELTRTLDRFERGRYRIVRVEDYTDDEPPRFLRSRDARQYDQD